MEKPTRAQMETVCGAIDDSTYSWYCQFVEAVNAEHKANPDKTERECYRDLFNWIAERNNYPERL